MLEKERILGGNFFLVFKYLEFLYYKLIVFNDRLFFRLKYLEKEYVNYSLSVLV